VRIIDNRIFIVVPRYWSNGSIIDWKRSLLRYTCIEKSYTNMTIAFDFINLNHENAQMIIDKLQKDLLIKIATVVITPENPLVNPSTISSLPENIPLRFSQEDINLFEAGDWRGTINEGVPLDKIQEYIHDVIKGE